ncbi:hypothetical protein C4578_01880 [Candidatus Microgenomates bacterium]|nr:MAG: hypothetical protein C4578_01880 [Candidatus Microgenomates bacterium]
MFSSKAKSSSIVVGSVFEVLEAFFTSAFFVVFGNLYYPPFFLNFLAIYLAILAHFKPILCFSPLYPSVVPMYIGTKEGGLD